MIKLKYHKLHDTDGAINTVASGKIDLLNPTADMVHIADIARGLSNVCRFGGQIPHFYSVAQHSILVAKLMQEDGCDSEQQFYGLMHDASEAYLGDMVRPVKLKVRKYQSLEKQLMKVIAERFEMDYGLFNDVKPYDRLALEMEFDTFFNDKDLLGRIYSPSQSRERFMTIYKVLVRKIYPMAA